MKEGFDAERFNRGLAFLAGQGLNLCAVFDVASLPSDVTAALEEAGAPLASAARLILLGHCGRRLWEAMTERNAFQGADPIDHYSVEIARRFAGAYLNDPEPIILYPGPSRIPLNRLGMLAGWCTPSPLGLGIHPDYGLWFAYRVVMLTTTPAPVRVETPRPRPCDTCREKPCVRACPVHAVKSPDGFDVLVCARFRIQPDSPCQYQCLARLACPVAPEHRYSPEQLHYHYAQSLSSIRRYLTLDEGSVN